jgi:AmmeMemoRadiSam system protein B
MSDFRPKFRPVHPHLATARGQQVLVLQDPLNLAGKAVFIPPALAPMLALCDGSRNLSELRASLMIRAGISLPMGDLERIVAQLDDALLFENERSASALQEAAEAYRSAPFRRPTLVGRGYPAEPDLFRAMMDDFLDGLPRVHRRRPWRGLVSPHIDYERGGSVYAEVWSRAAEVVREAELIVVLGTDHHGDHGQITLTRQSYATPYGVLPTDQGVVDVIADAIGEGRAFGEELHHRDEHSIELAVGWLHHMRDGEPCALVPILTGSFSHFVDGEGSPAEDPTMVMFLQALQDAMAGRAALVVAAGDLAHIGPAFDGPPVDGFGLARLKAEDERLVSTICAGDAEAFFSAIRDEGDRRNVCGLPPIYLLLRLLGAAQGEPAGYERCPADTRSTSFVSICGVLLE